MNLRLQWDDRRDIYHIDSQTDQFDCIFVGMQPQDTLAEEIRETLRPIWRNLTSGRTISIGKLGILAYLSTHGPAASSTLATAENISPQAIATGVRELYDAGLVDRTPDLADRRRVWIAITAAGILMLAQERSRGLEWLERAIDTRLSADEQQILASTIPILRKLSDNVAGGRVPK